MATAEQIRDTFERYARAMSDGDVAGIVSLFSDDAWLEDPVGADRTIGRQAIEAHYTQAVQQAGSSLELVAPRVAEPDHGAAALRARSTMGDTAYDIDIIDVFTFDAEGRVTSMTAYWGPTNVAPAG